MQAQAASRLDHVDARVTFTAAITGDHWRCIDAAPQLRKWRIGEGAVCQRRQHGAGTVACLSSEVRVLPSTLGAATVHEVPTSSLPPSDGWSKYVSRF